MFEWALLDWSGVISIDFPIILRCLNMVLARLDLLPMTAIEFRQKAELPISNFWRKTIPHVSVEQANAMLREAWVALDMQAKPFPGIQDLLWLFHRRGIKIIIVSSHYCEELRRESFRYGVDRFIYGFHGCVKNKVHASKKIVQKYGVDPGKALVVGDMAHDIEMGLAIKAKMVIGLTCGYDTKAKLLAAGAHCVRGYPTELACLI